MQVTRSMLEEAVATGVISSPQAGALWDFLSLRERDTPSFKPAHVLYYLGGMIAIGAMTLFMTLGWERFGGGGLLAVSAAYAIVALALAERFLARPGFAIPAGIAATLAVVMVPLGVYGLQHLLGFWADGPRASTYRDYHRFIDWRWLVMELATLGAAAVALWRYRLPFLVMPVAVTLWYMSMDLTPFLFGREDTSWDLRKLVSLWFGLLMLLVAFWIDLRTRSGKDFAFWLYLFGMFAFWGGLTLTPSQSAWSALGYLAINLLLLVLGPILGRRVFTVFGGLGVAGYLSYLAYGAFKISLLLPFILSAIGLAIVYLGIVWQRHEARIGARLRGWLPEPMRALVQRQE